METLTILLLLLSFFPFNAERSLDFFLQESRCEPVTAGFCAHIGYNKTKMPNAAGNENQNEAKHQISTYEPLLKIKCSPHLKFFLCSVYFPMCNEMVQDSIGPCRPLCESVRRRCEPTLRTFGFPWPDALDCSKFPPKNDARTMCMRGPTDDEDEPAPVPDSPGTIDRETLEKLIKENSIKVQHPFGHVDPSVPIDNFPAKQGHCKDLRVLVKTDYRYVNTTGRCAPVCGGKILFTDSQRNIATVWMGSLTGMSLLVTICALVALGVSSIKVGYPEKAVVLITLCSGLASIGYLIRFFSGHSAVACTSGRTAPLLVVQGLQNLKCTIVFIFQYYFTMVASMWWLVLCTTWFLMTGPNWSGDALEKRATIYHIFAWIIPGLQTIVILVRQSVEADDLTGLCNVGNVNTSELLQFVILPSLICLIFGIVLLTLGFVATLCCSTGENFLKPTQQTNYDLPKYSEGAILRLGILAVFYIVPSGCLIAAQFYEYSHRPYWLPTVPEKTLRRRARPGFSATDGPNFETFVMKICVTLIYGICSAIWIIVRVCSHSCTTRPAKPTLPYTCHATTPLTGSSASNPKYPTVPQPTPSPNYLQPAFRPAGSKYYTHNTII